MCSELIRKQPLKSWYIHPSKNDVPPKKFELFANKRYDKQSLDFVKEYSKSGKIPNGMAWNPMCINQKSFDYMFLRLEVLLLALMCLDSKYKH